MGLAAEKAQDQLSQANEQLRVDIEKWHEAKNKEICQFMRQFATNHMEYHQKVCLALIAGVNLKGTYKTISSLLLRTILTNATSETLINICLLGISDT